MVEKRLAKRCKDGLIFTLMHGAGGDWTLGGLPVNDAAAYQSQPLPACRRKWLARSKLNHFRRFIFLATSCGVTGPRHRYSHNLIRPKKRTCPAFAIHVHFHEGKLSRPDYPSMEIWKGMIIIFLSLATCNN